MEEMTVVYFCVEKEGCGRKWRGGKWQYRITEEMMPVRCIIVWLPPFCCRKKPWKEAGLISYLQGLAIPKEGGRVYYLYGKEAGRLLGRQSEVLSAEWLLFMVEQCMMERNALVILQDREMDVVRLVEKYVASVRYIGIVTANGEEWEGMQEALAEEYGFLLDVAEEVRNLRIPQQSKALWVAGRELYGMNPVRLMPDSIWLSTDISNEEGKKICARGRNILYMDVGKLCHAKGN